MSIITKYFNRAPKRSEVVSAVQSGFTNQEKEEVVKQLNESVNKRGNYRTQSVEKKLGIDEYAIRHGVASTLGYFSSKYPRISKQSISDFKKVC